MQSFFDSVYDFFYTTIQQWNKWLILLQRNDPDAQLVTTEHTFSDAKVNAPTNFFKKISEK